jgi:hypothetical protein
MMWINSADDFINARNFDYPQRAIPRMPNARFRLIERDHPAPVDLAHQPRVDAFLRVLRTLKVIAADEHCRVRRQVLDADIVEVQCAAPLR